MLFLSQQVSLLVIVFSIAVGSYRLELSLLHANDGVNFFSRHVFLGLFPSDAVLIVTIRSVSSVLQSSQLTSLTMDEARSIL